jgi:O-succinylbenzoate synthase
VRLEDAAGAVGWGEAAPIPDFGTETVDEIAAACAGCGEWTTADGLAAVPARLGCLHHALAAARAELAAGAGEPEHSATPGNPRHYVAVAALLPAGRAALAQIPARVEMGFRVFKWKVGVGDAADELALLDDVCAALPSGAKLRLDANGAWERRQAERWLGRCADRPVEFVEQPCAAAERRTLAGAAWTKADDLLLGLAGDFPTPLALDESVVGAGDVERWLGAGWPGVFVIKPSLLADVAGTLAQLEKARVPVVFSSALETAVGARTALRTALAWSGEPRAAGFGVWPLFASGVCNGPTAAPFIRAEDVAYLNPEAAWNALS